MFPPVPLSLALLCVCHFCPIGDCLSVSVCFSSFSCVVQDTKSVAIVCATYKGYQEGAPNNTVTGKVVACLSLHCVTMLQKQF